MTAGEVGALAREWQTLLAGLLGLGGGVLAYIGAIRAGRRQVAAVTNQIEDARSARRQIDERRLSVMRWAVRTEANRLAAAVTALRNRALPSGPQLAARSREQLVIESSPLLRGEREEISLLDDRTRAHLEKLARVLDEYKTSVFKPRRLCLRRCLLWSKGL